MDAYRNARLGVLERLAAVNLPHVVIAGIALAIGFRAAPVPRPQRA